MASSEICTLFLSTPTTTEALRAFRDEASAELTAGRSALVVDIDGIDHLDSPVIACLITTLREARERGAVLSLCVSRRPLMDTLRVTGLDRIFTLVTPLAALAARPVRRRRTRNTRFVAGFVATLLAVGWSAGDRANADADLAAQDIVRNVAAQSDRVASYEATIGVDIHLRSFPYLSQHLDGTTYFKRPDNFEVVFRRVPTIAKGFDKLYSDLDDPSGWERRFDLSLVGERTVDGHRDLVVRLVQKVRGMIDHEDVAIDPSAWRIDEMEWHYYNGGVIAMSQQFASIGGYTLLAAQHATIHIPYIHAAADAVYTDYKTNVAIDDDVFTRAKK